MRVDDIQKGDEIAEMSAEFRRQLANRLRVCQIAVYQWDIDPYDLPEEFK